MALSNTMSVLISYWLALFKPTKSQANIVVFIVEPYLALSNFQILSLL